MNRFLILLNFFGYGTFMGVCIGSGLACIAWAILSFFYLPYLPFALVIGLVAGGLFGSVNGLVLGMIAMLWWHKTIPQSFSLIVILIALFTTLFMGLPLFASIGQRPNMPMMILLSIPAIIGAIYGGHQIARWHSRKYNRL